jgi:hypothetical protein
LLIGGGRLADDEYDGGGDTGDIYHSLTRLGEFTKVKIF